MTNQANPYLFLVKAAQEARSCTDSSIHYLLFRYVLKSVFVRLQSSRAKLLAGRESSCAHSVQSWLPLSERIRFFSSTFCSTTISDVDGSRIWSSPLLPPLPHWYTGNACWQRSNLQSLQCFIA